MIFQQNSGEVTRECNIPFNEGENILLYDEGIENFHPPERFLYRVEFLFWWPDKTLLHAGAVEKDGKAYVFTGSGNVGKTSCVLKLLRSGYNFLSDDWLIIGGGKAYPFPKRIRIFDYNLKDNEIAKRALGHKRLLLLLTCKLLDYSSKISPHKYLKFVVEKLRERTILREKLHKIFPEAKIAEPSPISKVFFLERRKIKQIELKRDISSRELARKMAYYRLYEWSYVLQEYYRYVNIFGVENKRVENMLLHDITVMEKTFEKCDLYRVLLPERLNLFNVDLASILPLD